MGLLPPVADELTGLTVFLDAQRAAIARKLSDLSDQDARRRPTASALSLLGIVKHLGHVERRWFQAVVAGRHMPGVWPVEDREPEYRVDDDDTVDSVLGFYEAMVGESRSITAEVASPDAACRHPDTAHWSLRWILLHMIEETARHAGHADIIRESIDGVTGV
jgi:uncharacterized damage-inducible protein DinB